MERNGHIVVRGKWVGLNKSDNKQFASIRDSFKIEFVRDEDEYILTSNKYKLNVFVNESEVDSTHLKDSLKQIYLESLADYLGDIAEFVYHEKTPFGDPKAVHLLNKMIEHSSKYHHNKQKKQMPKYDIFQSFELTPSFA